MEASKRSPRMFPLLIVAFIAICGMALSSCDEDGEPIDKPDEYTHIYRAKEKYILRAIYQIFKDKDFGKPTINEEKHQVTSDYAIRGEWRMRGLATVREVSRNEREVALSIITERKTPAGWELRRLLKKEQYERIFDAIDTQIYREIAKPD